jgi:homogentisate 1,2-dioxygenase
LKAGKGRKLSFPIFFVYQYEFFHYVEMCEILGYDVGLLKSRGIGFSEVMASLAARPYITTPNYRVVASAFSDRHLKPLLSKI